MLVNAVIERVPHHGGTRRIVSDAIVALRELLASSLHTARGIGEMPEETDIEGLAMFFVMLIQGVGVMGAVYSDKELLHGIIETASTVLPGYG